MHGRNSGKKLMAVRIVKHSFEIIKLTTDSNPVQILVDAIINGGPREDATRIGSAGANLLSVRESSKGKGDNGGGGGASIVASYTS